ncbi:hypothetical protein TNCV_4073001 [Trichonephila clavipes]|uniref:Uncharacterized protein n=1 Tax=Trichonephila clavipes TaxID=2585209 RepID=A0A8X7BGY9_TRICX|nr:hypothetical protein TNCV_4073001 [Trichonephila clavipes]
MRPCYTSMERIVGYCKEEMPRMVKHPSHENTLISILRYLHPIAPLPSPHFAFSNRTIFPASEERIGIRESDECARKGGLRGRSNVSSMVGHPLSYRTATAGSDVVQSGRPIFDDFFQHLWPYIGNNTANVVFQMVKRLWLIRIDQ